MERTELLLGDEAVASGAVDAGIGGAFAYPGTPSTEIFEFIEQEVILGEEVSADWSANEKVAYEEALGMSYAGRRALVSMKHVGLNVAADPFVNSASTGVNGGLVCAVADDPGMHSSQNEQDTRWYAEFAKVPCFEPATQQEAYDMTREAFDYSEAVELPVILRLVTRLAHSRSAVLRTDQKQGKATRYGELLPLQDFRDWTLVPLNARRRYRDLLGKQPRLFEDSDNSRWNRLELKGKRGIIVCGIAINYVRECLRRNPGDDWSILEIRHYPMPAGLIRQMVEHCDEILVVEDGFSFVEARLNGIMGLPDKTILGRVTGHMPASGELTPEIVAAAMGHPVQPGQGHPDLMAGRPPQLCKGCPHSDSYIALLEATREYENPILFSDIGCYTLAVMPPYEAVHSCVDMGSSISLSSGAARAGYHPVVCTIGDSTFVHSGMTPLVGAAQANLPITVMILDNAAVAMTGIQDSLVVGDQLVDLIVGLGVDPEHVHVMDPLPKKRAENVALLKKEIEHPGLSVIVPRRACIHVGRKKKKVAEAIKAATEARA